MAQSKLIVARRHEIALLASDKMDAVMGAMGEMVELALRVAATRPPPPLDDITSLLLSETD